MSIQYILGRQGRFFGGLDYPSAVEQTKVQDCTVNRGTQTTDLTARDAGNLDVTAPTRLEGTVSANFVGDPDKPALKTFMQQCKAGMMGCTPVFVNPALPVVGYQTPGMYTVTKLSVNAGLNEAVKLDAEFKLLEYQPELQFAFASNATACSAPSVSNDTPESTSCDLSWSAVTGAGGYAFYDVNHELVAFAPAGTTTLTLTGLTPSTSYTFYVYTTGNGKTTNVSEECDTVTFTTAAES